MVRNMHAGLTEAVLLLGGQRMSTTVIFVRWFVEPPKKAQSSAQPMPQENIERPSARLNGDFKVHSVDDCRRNSGLDSAESPREVHGLAARRL